MPAKPFNIHYDKMFIFYLHILIQYYLVSIMIDTVMLMFNRKFAKSLRERERYSWVKNEF